MQRLIMTSAYFLKGNGFHARHKCLFFTLFMVKNLLQNNYDGNLI